MLTVAPELVGTPSAAFEPITRANDPFLLPDMGASGVLGDPAAASPAGGEQFLGDRLSRRSPSCSTPSQPPTAEERRR